MASEALRRLLTSDDEEDRPGEGAGSDHGTGIAGRPVVGLLFWVRADDVGLAARTAVETARRAGTESGLGSELYDVVVIPRSAVAMADDPCIRLCPTDVRNTGRSMCRGSFPRTRAGPSPCA
jgi:hypothetical protein